LCDRPKVSVINPQLQRFNNPTFIYPMVPASAATLLQSMGHDVIWDEATAEQKPEAEWMKWFGGARDFLAHAHSQLLGSDKLGADRIGKERADRESDRTHTMISKRWF
jgi:hypothetical protein